LLATSLKQTGSSTTLPAMP